MYMRASIKDETSSGLGTMVWDFMGVGAAVTKKMLGLVD